MEIEKKLSALGLTLPPTPTVVGNYAPYVKVDNLLYLAGTLPVIDGKISHAGKVSKEFSIEEGYLAVKYCALNTLSNIKMAIRSLDAVRRIILVNGFVNAKEGFADSPAALNGASDLFVELFGEIGRHARAAVAMAGLLKNATVEIQCIVQT